MLILVSETSLIKMKEDTNIIYWVFILFYSFQYLRTYLVFFWNAAHKAGEIAQQWRALNALSADKP